MTQAKNTIMTTNNHKTTFWELLNNYSIEIPIIQRDYAQGREGKESLRKNFLSDLKNALDNRKEMKLDFVYGSTENGKLYPLDGQQRLTTLWLLHWYIALKAGKLKDASACLVKFSYETRVSSREFCKALCDPDNFDNYHYDQDVIDFITNQTWFYSAWKQDPTIQSMLRMLGGSKDIISKDDGIEVLFGCDNQNCVLCSVLYNECIFDYYFDLLTGQNCPIVFYYLPKDFGNSDDLYIKMNARGEQLTSFENFKADLIGYITKQSEDNTIEENIRKEWKKLLDPKDGIPIKLDTDWTDIFWKNKSKDYKIDEIYFAFLNRFFFNELICQKHEIKTGEDNKEAKKYAYSADSLEKDNKQFKYLYGEKGDDSKLEYNDLGDYLYHSDGIPFQLFGSLQKTLNNFYDKIININDYFPRWVNSEFQFIPICSDGGISLLGQKERIVFLAVCRYFEKVGFDEFSFKSWMRVVWNIVENSDVNTVSSMIGTMRLIQELSYHSHNIYGFLVELGEKKYTISSNVAKDQMQEEITKAKYIQYCMLCEEYDNCVWRWEKIIDAENYAFFKGAIRFLYTDGDGNVNWNHFNKKRENVQKFFDEKGVREGFRKDALFLRALLSRIKIEDTLWFGNGASFWRESLLKKEYKGVIHALLTSDEINIIHGKEWIDSETLLAEVIKDNDDSWHILTGWRDCDVLTKYHRRESGSINYPKEVVPLNHFRNQLLKNEEIKVTDCRISNCDYYYGWDVAFNYFSHAFLWDSDDKVYLLNNNEKIKVAGDEDECYCFSTIGIVDERDFIETLQCLINKTDNLSDNKVQKPNNICINKCNVLWCLR